MPDGIPISVPEDFEDFNVFPNLLGNDVLLKNTSFKNSSIFLFKDG